VQWLPTAIGLEDVSPQWPGCHSCANARAVLATRGWRRQVLPVGGRHAKDWSGS